MSVSRLDIRNKCLTVKQNDGCLFIKEQTGELGYEHLLCVSGDERVLAHAFLASCVGAFVCMGGRASDA